MSICLVRSIDQMLRGEFVPFYEDFTWGLDKRKNMNQRWKVRVAYMGYDLIFTCTVVRGHSRRAILKLPRTDSPACRVSQKDIETGARHSDNNCEISTSLSINRVLFLERKKENTQFRSGLVDCHEDKGATRFPYPVIYPRRTPID